MLEWTHVRSSEEDRGGAASAEESSQAAAAACEVLEAREIGMSSGKGEEKVRVANLERLKRGNRRGPVCSSEETGWACRCLEFSALRFSSKKSPDGGNTFL